MHVLQHGAASSLWPSQLRRSCVAPVGALLAPSSSSTVAAMPQQLQQQQHQQQLQKPAGSRERFRQILRAVGIGGTGGGAGGGGGAGASAATAAKHHAANGAHRRSSAAPGASAAAAADGDGPWLIVGLGNPGAGYANTRHNVGFVVVDVLAASAGIDTRKLERSAAVGRGELHGRKVILAKPMTFMNNSGEAVSALARYHKIPPARVLVVADDLDLPLGAVRLRLKGGHGGHNGLRSVAQHLKGQDFPRVKIGIGRPPGTLDVASFVLQPFRAAEREHIDGAVAEAVAAVEACLALGPAKAVSGSRLPAAVAR